MLTLYYGPGACSMASHIVLEESGEKYEPKRMDLAKGEQRTPDYLKINPQGRVPLLQLDNGEPLAENTAILPYLGKRFSLWPTDADGRGQGAVADRLLRRERAPGARPCRAAGALHRRPVGVPRHQGAGAEDLPRPSQADRRHAGRPRMARRRVLGARSLWLRVLHLGRAPRAADGRAEELHRVQGPHDASGRRCARVLEDEKIKV